MQKLGFHFQIYQSFVAKPKILNLSLLYLHLGEISVTLIGLLGGLKELTCVCAQNTARAQSRLISFPPSQFISVIALSTLPPYFEIGIASMQGAVWQAIYTHFFISDAHNSTVQQVLVFPQNKENTEDIKFRKIGKGHTFFVS